VPVTASTVPVTATAVPVTTSAAPVTATTTTTVPVTATAKASTVDFTKVFGGKVFRGILRRAKVLWGSVFWRAKVFCTTVTTIKGTEVIFHVFELRSSCDKCKESGKEKKMLEFHHDQE
jgi:hypothetical protein